MKQYKVILSNNRLYKEIELAVDTKTISVGTKKECDIRLKKELFFDEFRLDFICNDNSWNVNCDENVYISNDGMMKHKSLELYHGEKMLLKYTKSNQELLSLSFTFDFDAERKDYRKEIDVSTINSITIGNNNADIIVEDELLGKGTIRINKNRNLYEIVDENTKFGVYVNGVKVDKMTQLHNMDFIDIGSYSFYFKEKSLFTSSEKQIETRGLKVEEHIESKSKLIFPEFYRNTRAKRKINDQSIEIGNPKPKNETNKKSILFTLIPALAMLALTIVMRGILGSGGNFVIYSAISMSLGIITSVVTYFSDKKEIKRKNIEREIEYKKYIEEKERLIEQVREEELNVRRFSNISIQEDIEEVENFSNRLFEKDIYDEDFLRIYLGKGKVVASNNVEIQDVEFIDYSDEISRLPQQVKDKYCYIEDAPITVDLMKIDGLGVVGEKQNQYTISKNIILDICVRHYYNDVKIYYILNEDESEDYSWIRWLKHIHNDRTDIRNIAYDDESKGVILENLYMLLSSREDTKDNNKSIFLPQIIVLVNDINSIRVHPISKYFEKASQYGFTFVFFSDCMEFVPKGCRYFIDIKSNSIAELVDMDNIKDKVEFTYPEINNEIVEDVVSKLGAIHVGEVSIDSELTKNITLYEMLNIVSAEDIDLKSRWEKSKVFNSIAVPLGVKKKNEMVYLDISDKGKAHGPHGLVAGTTGSGKSEILQTYVLSIATHFHPYDVSFVIIDFKGGGMANQFKDLPHLIGAITNIDGREINRSLLSIKAELIRRQEMFSKADVNHINDYIKLYKKGDVKEAMPHLIMIVDEFAELKAEHPDFMKEIISAARIGRTLGVHLILATQKPSGVVDSQIWSNSKFKLCLKVQSKEDSNEVLKSPLAAEIKEPGRAYFQVGNNEIFELFQSAYSGAKAAVDENSKPFSIYELNLWGKKKEIYTNKKKNNSDNSKSQLDEVVEYIHNYCDQNNIIKLPGICLPPLKDILFMNEIKQNNVDIKNGIEVSVGIYDDPEQQRQKEITLNFSDGNTFIMGAAQSGKTTLLQSIMYGIMNRYSPKDVNIYIVDCGTMSLKIFEGANHVGGVVVNSDEDKMRNLFNLLIKISNQRKIVFAQKGLGTFKAYIEAGFDDLPQIIVIIDNMAAFKEYFGKMDEQFSVLIREGQSLGINFIVTANQANALGARALANFSTRIALFCNERSEYSNIFDRCRIEPKETPGRGLCIIDKRILEFQSALAFEGEKEIDRVNSMKSFIESNAIQYENEYAKEIPMVPTVLYYHDMKMKNSKLYKNKYNIPVGIDFETVDYTCIDLATIGAIAVVGGDQMGKTNMAKLILKSLVDTMFDNISNVYIVDSEVGEMEEYGSCPLVKEYTSEMDKFVEVIDSVYMSFVQRKTKIATLKGDMLKDYLDELPLDLIIIDNWTLAGELCKNKDTVGKLIEMMREGKKSKVSIIFTNVENTKISNISSNEIMKFFGENKKFIAFTESDKVKITDMPIRGVKDAGKVMNPGEAYYINNGTVSKIKTAFVE